MATNETVKQINSGGTLRDVEDVGARQLIADLQTALNAITSGDTTTAIKTFGEIIAFLDNIEDTSTLQGIIAGLNTTIAGKVDKVTGKGLSTNDFTDALLTKLNSLDPYTKAQVDALITAASSGAVSVTTNQDGTFTIHVGETDYTINLNHTHPQYLTEHQSLDTPLVVVSTTGDVTQALDSGKWYRFGTIDSLTITLTAVASGYVSTYFGRFTASSNWTDISVPNGVTAAASNDTIAGGKTYEFSIVDGIIKINEV